MDYITPIKEKLDEEMLITCAYFTLVGSTLESPRWYNFREFDLETKILTIGSSQKKDLWFSVQTEFNFIDVTEFWQQFKEYRTAYLEEKFPSINTF